MQLRSSRGTNNNLKQLTNPINHKKRLVRATPSLHDHSFYDPLAIQIHL